MFIARMFIFVLSEEGIKLKHYEELFFNSTFGQVHSVKMISTILVLFKAKMVFVKIFPDPVSHNNYFSLLTVCPSVCQKHF